MLCTSHLAPKWFQDDQKKFSKGILPVTKEQINEERARNAEIAARPIKKVCVYIEIDNVCVCMCVLSRRNVSI
jgi:hypothetical protein